MLTSESQSHATAELDSVRDEHWTFHFSAATDVGRQRSINEDFYLLYPDRHLYIVADGMGGHAAGEVASRMAAETLAAYFDECDLPQRADPTADREKSMPHHLVQAVKITNSAIFEEAGQSTEREGMGTTIVALAFSDERAYWAHVGDSRLYRWRNRRLEPMTRDHSLLEQTLDRHDLTDEETRQLKERFPYKNVLSRALGTRYTVDVDVDSAPLRDGDLYAMTTDGVHDVVDDVELAEVLRRHRHDWHRACQTVVDTANGAGGPDNSTIACIETRTR